MSRSLSFFPLILLALAPHLAAAPVKTQHVEAELLSRNDGVSPGTSAPLGLKLKMAPGWHTYWRNPGDSGLPTTIQWKLPPKFSAGEIKWPYPQRLPVGPLMNFGYEGEVLLPVEITVPADLRIGEQIEIAARADWLVCKEICIPEGADLRLNLPVKESVQAIPTNRDLFIKANAKLPLQLSEWRAQAHTGGQSVLLTLTLNDDLKRRNALNRDFTELSFFPHSEGLIEPAGKQRLRKTAQGEYQLELPIAKNLARLPPTLEGVVVAHPPWRDDAPAMEVRASIEASAIPSAGATSSPAGPSANAMSFWLAIAFAFFGGVLLNLMPCVFPVLSIKVLGFAESAHGDRAAIRKHGVTFALGVVVSFWILLGVFLVLRAAGNQLGWGFQLQSPAIVVALAVLFFILALNLSGWFEFGQLIPNAWAGTTFHNAYANSFLTGALAVVVASPCTAPFMGAALGYAVGQSTPVTVAVFTVLGFGMAFPYLLLAWFPQWLKRLPRPGLWMVKLKQLLAFPLYATVIWLAWVLGIQLGLEASMWLAFGLLLIAIALWLWRQASARAPVLWRITAVVVALLALATVLPERAEHAASRSADKSAAESGWETYTPAKLAALRNEGKAVFVDFTAAWCVTCQVNKHLVLDTDDVRDAFLQKNVILLRADWTIRDADITQALAEFGRNGVPVYVLYRPGKEPLLLPEVLRKESIFAALATL